MTYLLGLQCYVKFSYQFKHFKQKSSFLSLSKNVHFPPKKYHSLESNLDFDITNELVMGLYLLHLEKNEASSRSQDILSGLFIRPPHCRMEYNK